MATQLHLAAEKKFKFHQVQIMKSKCLGKGSYGVVYEAKCDQLLCAAKLFHPVFLQDNVNGSRRIRERFDQECHFLSDIRHPHIVQYLGTSTDKETSLPVLLMELLDENLTHFLEERANSPLPYHIEIDLCHDIALGLDFLHSNDIIHRDLSSNNVLLMAGRRAKVTDFGMSRILEADPSAAIFTHCPGTTVYMPPEGLKTPPMYSTKLDCFSFGVLGIQIMTCQFPNPGPPERDIEDARSPVGSVKVPIPDVERRQSEISLISQHHPLRHLTLQCLSYNEKERPSAKELCLQLHKLRNDQQYIGSQKKEQLERKINEQLIHRYQQQLEEKAEAIAAGYMQQQELKKEVKRLTEENESREVRMQQLSSELIEYKVKLAQQERVIEQLHAIIESKEGKRSEISGSNVLVVQGAECQHVQTRLDWQTNPAAPSNVMRGSTTVIGDTAYFSHYAGTVYKYDRRRQQFSILPQCPSEYASLVEVKGQLTAVGGIIELQVTDILYTLSCTDGRREWIEQYPPMPTKCWNAAAVCNGKSLVIAGGRANDKTACSVQVMDTIALVWSLAQPLPHYFHHPSATICGDNLYLMGGYDKAGIDGSLSVLTCSLTALLNTCVLMSTSRTKMHRTSGVWKVTAETPVYFPTCVTFNECVLAVGGNENASWREPNPSDTVYQYNPSKDSWMIVSHIPTPRFQCLVAILPGNELMVVGGRQYNGALCNIVEVGTLE